MAEPAIDIKSISKRYRLPEGGAGYGSFRESLMSLFRGGREKKEFWALEDVSFSVARGEAVGIIGENGAGKTTLLKILSRIIPPTSGHAVVRGAVSSLLEVGTGFHPELTGLENIYLNGSILGLKRAEINNRLGAIVDFAEVGAFLGTPLKHYSTGMWARLAFSVAAHLDAEILLIDEVLSVGDSEFQNKSLGKMNSILSQGRTILFVSHNMAAVRRFCNRCVWISRGRIKSVGAPGEVISSYLSRRPACSGGAADFAEESRKHGGRKAWFERIELRNQRGEIASDFNLKDDLHIHLHIAAREVLRKAKITIDIREPDGNRVCNIFDSDSGFSLESVRGKAHVSLCLPDLRLYPGAYIIGIELESELFSGKADIYDYIPDAIAFNMSNTSVMRRLRRSDGLLYITPDWRRHADG